MGVSVMQSSVCLYVCFGNFSPWSTFPSDVSTLFRGNTLLSKCVDETMRLAGKFYLESFMRDHIERIFLDQKHCEIDPARLPKGFDVQANMVWALCKFDVFFFRLCIRARRFRGESPLRSSLCNRLTILRKFEWKGMNFLWLISWLVEKSTFKISFDLLSNFPLRVTGEWSDFY